MSMLYKYIRDLDALPTILAGQIKITPVDELNDPSELIPRFNLDEVQGSLDRLREVGYQDEDIIYIGQQSRLLLRLAPEIPALPAPKSVKEANAILSFANPLTFPFLASSLEMVGSTFAAKVGLFCLTTRNDSLPMWAHYTDNAKGLVVEFLDLEQTFTGDETGVLYKLVSVRYEQELRGVTFDPRSHESIFFSKPYDWNSENEVRVVVPLSDCAFNPENKRYLFKVSQKHISRIILGWRMPHEAIKRAIEIVGSIKPTTQVWQSQIIQGRFAFGQKLSE